VGRRRKLREIKPERASAADRIAGQILNAAILKGMEVTAGPREPKGCRFIEGDVRGGDWRFCQKPQEPGSPYCAEHGARCFVRQPKETTDG
jgi:hypothetical protein